MSGFILFGTEHFIALGLGVFSSLIILILAYCMDKKNRVNFFRAITLLILGIKIAELLYRYYYNGESYIYLLPLHLCNLSLILAILTSFFKSSTFFQPLYFWGAGAIFALITPELNNDFSDVLSISFFVTHFFIILSVIYTMLFFKFRPTKVGVVSSFILVNLIALGVFYINKKLGTNYLYVNRIPNTSTLLDVLGPWPYYIISVEMLYLLVSFILYYPFRGKRLKFTNF